MKRSQILFLLLLLLGFMGSAQEIGEKNTDILLQKGMESYRKGNFDSSLAYASRGLQLAPEYHDLRLLRIRSYHAMDQTLNALNDLIFLAKKAPDYFGVLNLIERQVRLMDNEDKALIFLQEVEPFFTQPAALKILKAQIYRQKNDAEQARKIAEEVLGYKDLTGAETYSLHQLLNSTVKNSIGMSYEINEFKGDYRDRKSWQTYRLEYQHNVNRTVFLGRVNFMDRAVNKGVLYEIESYPVINERLYFFTNLGFSDGEVFPEFRGSTSVYYNFAEGFEAEGGARLLSYNQEEYLTLILGLTKYLGHFYLNVRTGLGPKRGGTLVQNHQLNLRYYFKGPDNYLLARLSRGISPDQLTQYNQVKENPHLEVYMAGLGANFKLGYRHIINLSGGIILEDLPADRSGHQIISAVGYQYRF